MKKKVVLIYVEALYMNYHRNAFLKSLIKNSKNWYKFNLSETFQDPLKQKKIIDLSKSADVLVVDTSVFSIAYEKIPNIDKISSLLLLQSRNVKRVDLNLFISNFDSSL